MEIHTLTSDEKLIEVHRKLGSKFCGLTIEQAAWLAHRGSDHLLKTTIVEQFSAAVLMSAGLDEREATPAESDHLLNLFAKLGRLFKDHEHELNSHFGQACQA